jgi:hypothetical protein
LVGNPNCGKTALFNILTGSRQKVANYAGVTVERKEGSLLTPSGRRVRILDLPGAYSLDPLTPDEQVTADVLLGRRAGESQPDFVVCVTDATNLRQNLRLALSLKRLGLPMVVALNMSDIARRKGIVIDADRLAHELGVPVVETIGVKTTGVKALIAMLDRTAIPVRTRPAAVWLPLSASDIEHDQAEVRRILGLVGGDRLDGVTLSDRVDAVVLHPVLGPLILAVILFLVFQAVFAWAQLPMDEIKFGVAAFGNWLGAALPASLLKICSRGVLAGSQRSVFLPQIIILVFSSRCSDAGIPRARRFARPGWAPRVCRVGVHSPAIELCLCDSGDHGDAHDSKSPRSPGDDHDCSSDDLFRTLAGVCADHRCVHSPAVIVGSPGTAGSGVVRAVRAGGGERLGGGLCAQAQRRFGFQALMLELPAYPGRTPHLGIGLWRGSNIHELRRTHRPGARR